MLNDFKELMRDYFDVSNVTLQSNFKKDFGLTSFDFVNLICIIEDKYEVELEEKDYRELNTVEDLIHYLEKKNAVSERK